MSCKIVRLFILKFKKQCFVFFWGFPLHLRQFFSINNNRFSKGFPFYCCSKEKRKNCTCETQHFLLAVNNLDSTSSQTIQEAYSSKWSSFSKWLRAEIKNFRPRYQTVFCQNMPRSLISTFINVPCENEKVQIGSCSFFFKSSRNTSYKLY